MIQQISFLQKKPSVTLETLVQDLFSKKENLKFTDKTIINVLFISKALNNMLPPIFENWFKFFVPQGQDKLGAHSCCAPTMHLKQNWGEQNSCVPKIYLHIYNLAIKRQLEHNVCDLTAFIDFKFIRYRSKQSTSELSLIAIEMVFFPIQKLFLLNENLNKFHRYLLKTYNLHINSIQVSFHVVHWPAWLIWHNLYLCLHVL